MLNNVSWGGVLVIPHRQMQSELECIMVRCDYSSHRHASIKERIVWRYARCGPEDSSMDLERTQQGSKRIQHGPEKDFEQCARM